MESARPAQRCGSTTAGDASAPGKAAHVSEMQSNQDVAQNGHLLLGTSKAKV